MSLPNELFDEILDQLGEDRDALGACACACRAMCFMAQRRLFRKISLVLQGSVPLEIEAVYGRPERFFQLIKASSLSSSSSSHLADYVLHLSIHQMSRFPTPESLTALENILSKLRNVSEVSFPPVVNNFEFYDRYHQVIWAGLSGLPALLPNLDRMIKGNAIEKLDLVNVEPYPISELRGKRRFRRLALGLLDVRPPPLVLSGEGEDWAKTVLEVDDLVLHRAHPHTFLRLIDWLYGASSECKLVKASVRRLEVRTLIPLEPYNRRAGNGDLDWQHDMLFAFFSHVEVVHFSPNPDVVSLYQVVDGDILKTMASNLPCPKLGHLENLRDFTIQFELYTEFASHRFGQHQTAFGSSLEWVTALLGKIPLSNPTRVEKITFILEIKPHGSVPQRYHYQKYFLRIPEWAELVDVLVSGRFPALREVEMDVLVPGFVKEKEEMDVRRSLAGAEMFNQLRDKGIVLSI